MKFKLKLKKALLMLLIFLLAAVLVTSIVQSFNPYHVTSKSHTPEISIPQGSYEDFLKIKQGIPKDALDEYQLDFSKLKFPQLEDDIVVSGKDAIVNHAEGFQLIDVTDENGNSFQTLLTTDTGYATWTIPNVPESGFYQIYINYFPGKDGGANIERRVLINQTIDPEDPNKKYETQYENLENVRFPRFFTDQSAIIQDTVGNDMKPKQIEILDIQRKAYLRDMTGYVLDPYLIYLEGGKDNTITLESIREPMAVVSIGVQSYQPQISYSDYAAAHANTGMAVMDVPIRIEGEAATERTSPTLYAISDRTDPTNSPVDPVKVKLNAIGGSKWVTPGDSITWNVDLTGRESGMYYISFRAKQNVARGLFATRRVYINGTIPFMEANSARFSYSSDYRIVTLGSENEPFAFYLEGGKINTITLEATLGDYAEPISVVQDVINNLNHLYLQIIAITTVNPDPNQNYHLYGADARVANVLETFEDAAQKLEAVSAHITQLSGEKSDKEAILDTMVVQLRKMIQKPRSITERLSEFAKNISALGTWITTVKDQPLQIEALYVHSSLDQLPKANANWFSGTWFGMKGFVMSFFFDYESIGQVATTYTGKEIEVWFLTSATAGREQANSISTLITDTFTPEYGINVKLKVVSPGVLLPSTLAGTGPDIAINVDNGLPVNYAMRNAIYDISVFDEFYDVTGICSAANAEEGLCNKTDFGTDQYLFYESSMVPYEYDGGYYALPNTQSFLVMFYRKDIFEDHGWTVPVTWRDVTSLVTELSISNLQFYLPLASSGAASVVNQVFATMLYQRGGTFYRNENKESNFDSEEAMKAFEDWTKYYTDYSFPLSASFLNRFRTGETPIGIANYELFNTLTVFAPEIAGKWTFAPLPGYIKDGTLSNNGAASGSAIVMMKNAKDPESAWDFMRWWVSKDIQSSYARELESILGAAARHNTANVLAFKKLPWTKDEQKILISQWEKSVGVPEIPGGYYTGRNLENAFREVVNSDANPRETLQKYVILIDAEIRKKRAEFGLEE